MSGTRTLQDLMKSTPSADTAASMSILAVASSGALSKVPPKGVLTAAYVAQGDIVDMDEAVTPGLYSTGTVTDGGKLPSTGTWSASLVEVFRRGTLIVQRITGSTGHMAVRVRSADASGNKWGDWRVYQFS